MTKTEIHKLTKPQLVEYLIKTGYRVDAIGGMKRAALIQMAQNVPAEKLVALAEVEAETTPEAVVPIETEASVPEDRSTPGGDWTKYVLSQMTKGELVDGSPSCDGLRRVFQILVGPIISCTIDIVQVPTPENAQRATAICTIEYKDIKTGLLHRRSDAADCFEGNSKYPFSNYPTATAATMAEGRCLRKAMNIRAVTLEEVSGTVDESVAKLYSNATPITAIQCKVIAEQAKQIGINIDKLIATMGDAISGTELKNLTSNDAQAVFRKFREFDNFPATIPPEILT